MSHDLGAIPFQQTFEETICTHPVIITDCNIQKTMAVRLPRRVGALKRASDELVRVLLLRLVLVLLGFGCCQGAPLVANIAQVVYIRISVGMFLGRRHVNLRLKHQEWSSFPWRRLLLATSQLKTVIQQLFAVLKPWIAATHNFVLADDLTQQSASASSFSRRSRGYIRMQLRKDALRQHIAEWQFMPNQMHRLLGLLVAKKAQWCWPMLGNLGGGFLPSAARCQPIDVSKS